MRKRVAKDDSKVFPLNSWKENCHLLTWKRFRKEKVFGGEENERFGLGYIKFDKPIRSLSREVKYAIG